MTEETRKKLENALVMIREFLDEYGPFPNLRIHEEFRIDNDTIDQYMEGREIKSASLARKFIRFAKDVGADSDGIAARLRAKTSHDILTHQNLYVARTGSPQAVMEDALTIANSPSPELAIPLATAAFRMAVLDKPESGLAVLPPLLYVLNRYATINEFDGMLKHHILHLLRSKCENVTWPPHARAACLAVLAAYFSQGGRPNVADVLFQRADVRMLLRKWGIYAWIPTFLRMALYRHGTWNWTCGGDVDDAAAYLKEAESIALPEMRDTSICNARCEGQIALGEYVDGWEMLRPHYTLARERVGSFDFDHPLTARSPFPRFLQGYAPLVSGMRARLLSGTDYPADELERDCSLVERVNRIRPGRPLRLCCRPNEQYMQILKKRNLPTELSNRFRGVIENVRSEEIREPLESPLMSLKLIIE